MIPLGPILGVAGIAAATVLIPLGVNYHDNGIRSEYGAKLEAYQAKADLAVEKAVTEIRDSWRNKNDERVGELEQKVKSDAETMREMSRTIEIQLDQNPISVDASIARELYLSMCKIKAGSNIDARQACDLSASQADLARYSPVISVTAERIADWQFLCEETGSDDYCNPRVIGFAPGAMVQLIGLFRDYDTARMADENTYDVITGQINEILAMPGPTIKE